MTPPRNAAPDLATLAAMQGDLQQMVARSRQAVAVVAGRSGHPAAWSAEPIGMLAYAELLGGDPAGVRPSSFAVATRC